MHLENREFVMTRADLKAILAFASRDETRESTAGVWIDPARSRVFATDGSALAVAQCRGDVVSHEPPRMVPWADLDAALKHVTKRARLRVAFAGGIGSEGDGRQLGTGANSVMLTIDGSPHRTPYALPLVRCPDVKVLPIEHVIPRIDAATKPRVAWSTFNARYFGLAGLVAAAVDEERGDANGAIEFWPAEDKREPSVMLCSGAMVEWTVVVMPLRDGRQPAGVTADEAIAWAAEIAGAEVEADPYSVATAWRGALAGWRALPPAVDAGSDGASDDSLRRDDVDYASLGTPSRSPAKKRRKARKKPALRVVASS